MTGIIATSKSQVASTCNHNPKTLTDPAVLCSSYTLLQCYHTSSSPEFCGTFGVLQEGSAEAFLKANFAHNEIFSYEFSY